MESQLGRSPTQSEIFERTHTRKEDRNKWVDRRSLETDQILYKENLQKAEEERSTLISQSITDVPPVNGEEVWSRTVGGRKRGCVYGVGRVSAHPTPPLTDGEISDDISTASGPDLREQITRLNRELIWQFELVEEERTKYAEFEARYQAEREEWR
ncbi:hypothetical protein PIB30_091742 [Stylosanthes scabra]|uniref:Uncharacterized protein n=1 Tax=Stylosanthes scabra TaxID=79078 RepID=A0ABU6TU25_9FABA|nr:hypothetical protein [Stylosanthes scabra]